MPWLTAARSGHPDRAEIGLRPGSTEYGWDGGLGTIWRNDLSEPVAAPPGVAHLSGGGGSTTRNWSIMASSTIR